MGVIVWGERGLGRFCWMEWVIWVVVFGRG